jgi:hypothetical protein
MDRVVVEEVAEVVEDAAGDAVILADVCHWLLGHV